MKNEEDKENAFNLELSSEISAPPLYQVIVHNDDFTPMEFVVELLEKFFYMGRCEAAGKTMDAHVNGRVVCGIFSRDYAESKVAQVVEYAERHEHPLSCSMEVA